MKKLSQVTKNTTWKENRNFYARVLQQMVANKMLDAPFNKIPPEGTLPKLTKYDLVSLMSKFTIKTPNEQPPATPGQLGASTMIQERQRSITPGKFELSK
jgi:hypothetical protein